MTVHPGDTTFRDKLTHYLNKERIKLDAIEPYLFQMKGKTNVEKEEIAKELLRRIDENEINFKYSDRYEISEDFYYRQISSLLQTLRKLPSDSELTFTQLVRLAWDDEPHSEAYLYHWLLYVAEREGPELIPIQDKNGLPDFRQLFRIKRIPAKCRMAPIPLSKNGVDSKLEKQELYDWHDWQFHFCHTAAEVFELLSRFGVLGKTIVSVQAIGLGNNMTEDTIRENAAKVLDQIVSPVDEKSYREFPGPEKTMLPVDVELCEPLVILFDSGDTFALIPDRGKTMRLGINQANKTIKDGLNHSNFDSEIMFRSITGHSITKIEFAEKTECRQYGDFPEYDEKRSYLWYFQLENRHGFYFRQSWSGWYRFGLSQYNPGFGYTQKNELLPFREWMKAIHSVRQVELIEGHDTSSYFWIMPVKQEEHPPVDRLAKVTEHRQEEISIEEYDVFQYLSPFLERYFDPYYPYFCRVETAPFRFEWNLEYNLYSYDTMERMLRDIEECAALMEHDPKNQRLLLLLEKLPTGCFDEKTHEYRKTTPEEKMLYFCKNVPLYIDFYRRFVYRMRRMMARSPEYHLISFMGP